jgi:iron complex transport system substrate-binding protein
MSFCRDNRSELRVIGALSVILIAVVFLAAFRPVSSQSSGYPIRLVDDAGNVVTIYQRPTRIVSLSPSNTVLAYGLGLGNYLVGGLANEYVCATIAPQVKNLTSVGSYYGINFEEIEALRPQLVLASSINSPQDIQKLKSMNLTVLVLNATTIQGVERDIMLVGNATGTQQKAEEIVNWMNTVIGDVQSRLPQEKTKVFYLLDTTGGYWTGGNGTFINSMIDLAGGDNIASNISGWGIISPEAILAENPSVLILDQYANSSVVSQMPFKATSAVRNDMVYVIPHEGWFAQPTYRLVYGIVWLAETLHPNAMKGFEIPPSPADTGSESVTWPQALRIEVSHGTPYVEYGIATVAAIVVVLFVVLYQRRHQVWRGPS